MRRRCSDKRLMSLVRKALYALENPAAGFVFDDFDDRFREAEHKRETDAARWFYRDKTSFETKYEADCGRDPCNEPGWVSDGGRGRYELETIISATVDGDEDLPLWLVLWYRKRLELSPKRRAILDALAVDWRTANAARIAHVSRPTVDLAKKIFKMHFTQCFRAWKRDFAF